MGAAESTPLSPPKAADVFTLPVAQPGHPLHALLTHAALPLDPDHDLYPRLFRDFIHAHLLSSAPLAPLAPVVLRHPSSSAARALAAALRAAAFRLRATAAAAVADPPDVAAPPPFPPHEVLGALLLARHALRDLRAAGADVAQLSDVLGALQGATDIPRADRVDIGQSVLWQLVTSALDCLALHTRAGRAPSVRAAAIEVVFIALADELYGLSMSPEAEAECGGGHGRGGPGQGVGGGGGGGGCGGEDVHVRLLSAVVDRYPRPGEVVCGLMDVVAEAAAYADPGVMLGGSGGGGGGGEGPLGGAGLRRGNEAGVGKGQGAGLEGGMAALTASVSVLGLQSGFNEAVSAISTRLPLRGFMGGLRHGGEEHKGAPALSAPDLDSGLGSPFVSGIGDVDLVMMGITPPSPVLSGAASPRKGAHAGLKHGSSLRAPGLSSDDLFPTGFDASREQAIARESVSSAEQALSLLCVLCGPRPESPFRKALFAIQNQPRKGPQQELAYSFSKLYETLGKWMTHPRAALFGYYLLTGNRRFQTFALARTDPDVLLVPLLASMRNRCALGNISADAYIPAAIVLILTSDKGFCEAVDMIDVPNSWLTYIEDRTRLGSEDIALSGVILLVCARVVQQCLVLRRRMPECFLAGVCLSIMANVAGDATRLHSFAAERLLSLVDFLGRRRKKAMMLAAQCEELPSAPPPISESPRLGGADRNSSGKLIGTDLYLAAWAKLSAFEKSTEFLDQLAVYIGMSLEIVVSILRSRSVVSANRHLVYTLLHREAILDAEQVSRASPKCEALSNILRRMISFFGSRIDEVGDDSTEASATRKGEAAGGGGASGISVERVFEVIDKNARHVRPDLFQGLPDARFKYEECETSQGFIGPYSWSLATRNSSFFWRLDTAVIPIHNSVFQPSR